MLYETLGEALAAVPAGSDAPETTIKLLQGEVTCAFDVGTEDGSAPKNIVLDLAGNILNLAPAVGSAGTKSSGIRVLANSKLTLKNGQVKCSSAAADNIKVGIANYGTLELHSVVLTAGALTVYGVNNRGKLTLSGDTRINNGTGDDFRFGITNDPYEYIYKDTDAVVKCDSPNVYVQSMQIERYARETVNAGGIVLNITAGTFDRIVEDNGTAVDVEYNVSGGTIGVSTPEELAGALKIAADGATIKLKNDVTLGFDIGVEDGSVSDNVVLDLNGMTLTTAPAVGSAGTKTNGIRVLANSSLKLMNGTIVTPDETEAVKVKVGLANYGALRLSNVTVKAGNAVIYTINNRGTLTLSGATTVADGTTAAITNDPYDYIYTDQDAVLNVSDASVTVGKVLVERYLRNTTNAGGIALNISAGTFASVVDDNGTSVALKSGITGGIFGNDVSAFVQEGYECVQLDGSYTVKFIKLEQTNPLVFENPAPAPVTYESGKTISNPVISGGDTNGKITYGLVTGDSVTVDAQTGIVTIVKAGTSKIRATMEGNDMYLPLSAEYELTVVRADRSASFADHPAVVTYGTASMESPALTVTAGTGDISYQVVAGEEIADVDANGVLTFKDCAMGAVTVRATVAADDCYNSCSAEYTVTVEPLATPEIPYQAEGVAAENGWFKSDVTITAPGYTMSKSNSMTGEWVERFNYTEEGVFEETIYLKDENGFITDAVALVVKIDKTAPSNLEIRYSNYSWYDEIKAILGSATPVEVTFSFVENVSGPAAVEFSLDGGESYQDASYANGVYFTNVEPQYRGYVQFRVKDAAGHETRCDADGTLMVVDKEAPGIAVGYGGDCEKVTQEDGKVIVKTDEKPFQITFTVTDENLDLQEADPILIVTDENGDSLQLEVTWKDTVVNGILGKEATLTLTEDGVYNIVLTGSDRINEAKLQMEVTVDTTPPVLEVVQGSAPVRTVDGIAYYAEGDFQVKAYVRNKRYTESYRAKIQIQYTDPNGKVTDISGNYYMYGISIPNNWSQPEKNVAVKNITFGSNAPEGTYAVRLSFTGYGRNPQTDYSEYFTFVLDKSDPAVEVSYKENGADLISKIINSLGFSYAHEQVEVTITAADTVSGIHHLVYNIGDGVEHTVPADQLKNNEYTFTIKEEYRNMVAATAVDMADHDMVATGQNTVIIDHTEATFGDVIGMGSSGAAKYTQDENGVRIYKTKDDNFALIFEVSQKNFDASMNAPVIEYRREGIGLWVKVDEKYLTRTDLTDEEGKATGSTIRVALPADVTADNGTGDYEFRCTYSLFDGWQHSTSAAAIVRFDSNPPVIKTLYNVDDIKHRNDGIMYFYDGQDMTIQITEKNFSAKDVNLEVLYRASKNEAYAELTDFAEMAKDETKWLHGTNNVHELRLNFADEGYYQLNVTCIDSLDTNAAQNVSDTFVIDKNGPVDLTVDYQDSDDWTWIEALQQFFKFFSLKNDDGSVEEEITAILSATDAVTDISSIKVSVDGRTFQEADYRNGVYTYSLKEGFRDQLTVIATDDAMHESTLTEKGAVVVDSIDPDIDVEYLADSNTYGEVDYTTSEEFKVEFVVKDANYDLRAENALIKDGSEIQEDLVWRDTVVSGMPGGSTELTLTEQGRHVLYAEFTDRSGNKRVWTKTVVLDHTKPEVDVKFDDNNVQNPELGTVYYKTPQSITITVTETNFDPALVELKVTGAEMVDYAEYVHDVGNWTTVGEQHSLTIQITEDAEYELELSLADMAGNSVSYQKEFTIDQTPPELTEIRYSQKVWHTIVEDLTLGFFQAPVTVTITAKDETSGVYTISYEAVGTKGMNADTEVRLADAVRPDQEGKISFVIDQSFYGTITAKATDKANNDSAAMNFGVDEDGVELDRIVLDSVVSERKVSMSPVRIVAVEDMSDCTGFQENEEKVLYFQQMAVLAIEVVEDNFFEENYTIEINDSKYEAVWAADENDQTKYRCNVTIEDEGDYVVTLKGKDHSGNEMIPYKSQRIVVDHTMPVIDVKYMNEDKDVTAKITGAQEEPVAIDGPITAHVTIEEHNFRAEDVKILASAKNGIGTDILELDENGNVKVYADQGRKQNGEGETDPAKWSAFESGTWRRRGDKYEIELYFNTDATYTLQVDYEDLAKNTAKTEQTAFTVDNKDPVIIVEGVEDGAYYNEYKTVTIMIQEANFDPSGVEFGYTATNAVGAPVEVKDLKQDLKLEDYWSSDETRTMWKAELQLDVEANYTLSLSYTDPSGRTGKVNATDGLELYESAFTIDMTNPHDLSIEYSPSVHSDGTDLYYNTYAEVTLKATDDTAGMMAFEITVNANSDFAAATNWNASDYKKTVAYDEDLILLNDSLLASGMRFQVYGDEGEMKPYYENGEMIVTVRFYPQFHGDISFRAIDLANNDIQMVDDVEITVDDIAPGLKVELPEPAGREDQRLYYNDTAVTAKLTMTEANFYEADPVFKVNGAQVELIWNHDAANEIHTAEYVMSAEGDYVLSLEYVDRSGNVMTAYTSEEIVIDRTAPRIAVTYDLNTPESTHNGRAYYAQTRTATITVTERNFDKNDVKLLVESVDVLGNAVSGPVKSEWIAMGNDQYQCTLTYKADANYSFDVEYMDKATNQAADYAEDLFTVDGTAPSNVKISYSQEVLQTALSNITFGFYDAKVKVTLESEDMTAGIQEFVYSYINAKNVSSVNSGKTDQRITVDPKGSKATATFEIPQSALTNGTQFNGTVTATAIDRSNNKTTTQDDERIVVDKISPTATITYNDPVQNVDGTAYYADSITARIRINEANFYSSDVSVDVTRDGAKYPVTVSWNDESLDIHTGTFTLREEGDYVVTVTYRDKSGNAMNPYTSGKMVIDQAAPTIQVSNVVANSANDDEVYTFTITVDDADGNLRESDIHPVLTAVVRDENGSHSTQNIDLGAAKVTAVGKTYVYTVNDLAIDAIYTLSCSAADLAGNSVNVMMLDDGQSYEQVRFSINRNGSTFTYGDEETRDLAEQYYVQNVDHDVVIHEINVDPVTNYSVTVNGVELVEGDGYTTTISGGGSEWSLREYVINSELFAEEGEYSVVVKSVDATDATAYSDIKHLNMSFVVDRTAPTVVIGGLEDGGRYQSEGQEVTLIPSDEGGMLSSVVVQLFADGANVETDEPIEVLFDLSGEELMQYLEENGGVVTFVVPEGYQHTVHIICSDYAEGDDAQVNSCTNTFTKVTVSSDAMVIFFANKPLFYGAIFGILALLFFLFFLIFKRKKREEEAAQTTT